MLEKPALDGRDGVAFHVRGLTKTYRSGEVDVQALRGIDLDILDSEILVLLGPSGSGKSTFLNVLGGLDHPTAGDVMFRDHNLSRLSDRELTRYRRDHVGFVFQFYNLIPSLTARENVALVTEIAASPMSPEEAQSKKSAEIAGASWRPGWRVIAVRSAVRVDATGSGSEHVDFDFGLQLPDITGRLSGFVPVNL